MNPIISLCPMPMSRLATEARPNPSWLWNGYLVRGGITVLTSQWKSGKTTLLSVLLSRLGTGGRLADRGVRACPAIIVTEEESDLWAGRHARLNFPDTVSFLCRPFRNAPVAEEWELLIDCFRSCNWGRPYELVVIDTLAPFLPCRTENNAAILLEALNPLRALAGIGVSVLILHHPKKGSTKAGQASRGSGALAGLADILIEMEWFGRATSDDRRRTLLGFSRYSETPRRLVIELTADGTDYRSHGDIAPVAGFDGWPILAGVLAGSAKPLTRDEILAGWPADVPPPEPTVLWRWLDRAVKTGEVRRDGSGRRSAPFTYSLMGAGLDPCPV